MTGTARQRINSDPESVERGLVSLVLTLVELLRQLMERQAIRRVEEGALTDEQIERVGTTLMLLEEKMAELRDHFDLTPEDLNIDLGPLGPLLPTDRP
ncbi:gas vesicle protein GvpK [Mycobacterium sp. ACS1612]|uniref:gas vesicle protein K n=1 Tax=Mycobacterium sp. ACS1612 TaxID=1834117 RepID=UPI0007FFB903|nr:gas vesicle protein K [Mycobacterium sp. ACS1612]OBF39627.1 gas vesicle protein GvpK [Mycobacterium sp. ACS1612]